jgi:uncharacterized protein (DUF885 family)
VTPNDQVRGLVDRYWQGFLERQPLMGTYIGDERFDDRLPDPGPDGRAAEEAACRTAITELAGIDHAALDETTQLDADVLEAVCDRSLAALEHRIDRFEVVNHMHGAGTLLAQIASVQRADTPERLDRYEARLRAYPAFLEAASDLAREAVATGVVTPTIVAERALAQLERILALAPEDSPAMLPLGRDGDAAARERFAAIVREVLDPAHARFRDLVRDEYLPAATETIGLSALPGGEGMYAAEILGWTSLPLDPRSVHQLGNDRFEQIQTERYEVAAGLGYDSPQEAIAARKASGENTAASAEALVAMAEDQVRRSWEIAPSFFGTLPSANCTVRRVEEFREADEPFAFYNPPTEDGSRPGTYYINAYDLPDRALHHVASVTYHEANPGHHFQIALQQEMTDRSALRRFGGTLAGAAYCEGWGLYAERLADEMGLYLNGWERLGMLDNQAHRATRLITDTGIHALGWTRDSAIAKLEEAGQTHTDAVIEVDRYIAMPGQALCYMIGMLEIERARAVAAERANGDFSLRDFHDRVLATGELPLPSFRRVFGTD